MANENKKKGLTRKIQDFLASYPGKVMLNYAYSWGAAIVILGALFKLTHLPGANVMLFAGMGTEVLVFFISAFDRPYKSYKWESVFPNIKISGAENSKEEAKREQGTEQEVQQGIQQNVANPLAAALHGNVPAGVPGGTIIIGGGNYQGGKGATAGANFSVESGLPAGGQGAVPESKEGLEGHNAAMAGNMPGMTGVFAGEFAVPMGGPVTPGVEVSPEMEEATKAYLERLQEMTGALERFVEQTKAMGQDAEQINILNKNLAGINAIYEIQLRNISSQLGTLDQINDHTQKMAEQIDELNKVYARMLEAMTVNMRNSNAANV